MNDSVQQWQQGRFTQIGEGLPEPDLPVIAVTPEVRCLATLRKDGVWHYEPSGEKLPAVLAWSPV